jgi:Pyruvate/2-oxoacid:ferredoxin oxidoreductase gamma subunit
MNKVEDKGHIDILFKEGLKNYDRQPSEKVWDTINQQLNQNGKKTVTLPYRTIAAAIIAVMGLAIGMQFLIRNADIVEESLVMTEAESKNNTILNTNPVNKPQPAENLSKPKASKANSVESESPAW